MRFKLLNGLVKGLRFLRMLIVFRGKLLLQQVDGSGELRNLLGVLLDLFLQRCLQGRCFRVEFSYFCSVGFYLSCELDVKGY